MSAIKQAWKLHHQFRRAMSSRRDVPMPPIEGERLLTPYIEGRGPMPVDVLAAKRPEQVLGAQWLKRLMA